MDKYKFERHELMYGPHFNEGCATEVVSHMVNEDGTKGAHWTIEQTTAFANQYGVSLTSGKFNKYDWFVVLNMIRSDYYRFILGATNSDNPKHFVELAKAWLNDKDVEDGKTWNYFKYVVCGAHHEDEEEEEYEYYYPRKKHYEEDDYYAEREMRTRRPYRISRY